VSHDPRLLDKGRDLTTPYMFCYRP
jgi:hypothetical protein